MPHYSTLSTKGQVTIPVDVRRRLGIKEGDRLEFVFDGGQTVLRPVRDRNPFEAYVGALGGFSSREQIIEWVRDMRDED